MSLTQRLYYFWRAELQPILLRIPLNGCSPALSADSFLRKPSCRSQNSDWTIWFWFSLKKELLDDDDWKGQVILLVFFGTFLCILYSSSCRMAQLSSGTCNMCQIPMSVLDTLKYLFFCVEITKQKFTFKGVFSLFLYMKYSTWLYKHKLAEGCSCGTYSLSCFERNILAVCSGLFLGAIINK